METFIKLCLIYIIGATAGWITELIFRRIVHKKWINPGFLVGPGLPLYGTGTILLYIICSMDYSFIASPYLRTLFIIAIITVVMTVIEYITGLIFIKGMNVKLWDYSSRWGNIQGIICPLFTLFWGVAGALYYFVLHSLIASAADWIGRNYIYSFFMGIYFGIMIIDACYSFHIVSKIRKWAKEYNVVVKYEELKLSIRTRAEQLKQKRHFVLSFNSINGIKHELENYKNNIGSIINKRK